MRSLWVAVTVLALALAGCSNDPRPAATQDFSDLGLEATDSTGVIRGVVVDPAIKPIVDAVVTVKSTGASATTKDDGLFGFDGLEPGTYFIDVARPGYGAVQQSVDVQAGVAEPPIVKVLLQPDPSTAPYVEQFAYAGYISCSYKLANFVFDASSCDPTGAAGFQAKDDANPFFPLPRQPLWYQTEIIWDSTQPAGDELVTIQLACAEADCGETDTNRLCNVRGLAPLVCRVNSTMSSDGMAEGGGGHGIVEAELGGNNTGFTVGVYANCDPCVPGTILGVGLVLEQQYDVYAFAFYGYVPPEDWLFTESSTVPSPP